MKEFPTHDMFIAEIVSVSVDDSLMDESGKLCLENADLVAYSHGQYMAMYRKPIGRFGYSVMKPKTKKRLAEQRKKHNSANRNRRRK